MGILPETGEIFQSRGQRASCKSLGEEEITITELERISRTGAWILNIYSRNRFLAWRLGFCTELEQGNRTGGWILDIYARNRFLAWRLGFCRVLQRCHERKIVYDIYARNWDLLQRLHSRSVNRIAEDFLAGTVEHETASLDMNEIERVRLAVSVAYQRLSGSVGIHLENKIRERIKNLVTAVYLEEWLDHDTSTYQSLYSAVQKELDQRETSLKFETSLPKAMNRAANNLQKMHAERSLQANQEGKPDDGIESHKYSLVDLCDIKLNIENKLELIELLYYRKTPMVNTSDKGTHESLIRAYQEYSALLDGHEWDGIDFKKQENWLAAQEYVVRNMYIRKIESAYRFYLVKCIAAYLVKNPKVEEQLQNRKCEARAAVVSNLAAIWGRHEVEALQGGRKCFLEPYDVLDYDEKIRIAFSMEDPTDCLVDFRFFIEYLLRTVRSLIPPKQQRNWGKQEFCDAAIFFERYYPVCKHNQCRADPQSHQSTKKSPEEKKKTRKETRAICKRIEKIYGDLLSDSELQESGFLNFRETMMQFKRDKRYDKKK